VAKTTVHTSFSWFLGQAFLRKYMLVYDMTSWDKSRDYISVGIGVLAPPKPHVEPVHHDETPA